MQTPGGAGAWNGHEFFLNQAVEECDAWIVYEGLFSEETCRCPAGRRILITGEPSEIASYDDAWLRQFDAVRSVQANLRHKALQVGHTALPWHLGRSYDFLRSSVAPEKEADIGVICSDKAMTSGHRRRLRFIDELLKKKPMPRYGRGYAEIADKWDGLARFRYSMAIENSRHPHYWTEKITDCFLAETVPVYWGAPNIGDYFPKDAMVVLGSLDAAETLRILRDGVSKEDYARRLPALREAKRLVIEKYNLFELAARLAEDAPTSGVVRKVSFRPERRSRWRRLAHKVADLLRS